MGIALGRCIGGLRTVQKGTKRSSSQLPKGTGRQEGGDGGRPGGGWHEHLIRIVESSLLSPTSNGELKNCEKGERGISA
jgi:hypothetical protein